MPVNLCHSQRLLSDTPQGVICDTGPTAASKQFYMGLYGLPMSPNGVAQVVLISQRSLLYCRNSDQPSPAGRIICDQNITSSQLTSAEIFTMQSLGSQSFALRGGKSGRYCKAETTGTGCSVAAEVGASEAIRWA
jgi:hypothetical protein